MKYIKKEELIKDEVYYVEDPNHWMIGLVTEGNNGDNDEASFRGRATIITKKEKLSKDTVWCYKDLNRTYRLATPEEKHWLNTCIKLDKFIEFDEAMKTFIPEYVECITEEPHFYGKLETIYKVNNWNYSPNDCMLEGTTSGSTDRKRFKPSTKEAYDAQFVKVIEPLPQFKVIETIETITKVENNEGNQFFIGDNVKSLNSNQRGKITKFKYSNDKSDIIAITTFQQTNGISINKIEHYVETKTDYKILEYRTENGISCKAPFLADSHQFYIDERCKIYSIKRISDDLIITVGDEVLSKTCGVPNKILSIGLINNKIRLYPRNSFYNLEDILKN